MLFRPGDRVKIVNDDTKSGTIKDCEMTYKVEWDDGTQTYIVREATLRHEG